MDARDAIAGEDGLTLSRIRVRLTSTAEIVAGSGGVVRKPETVNFATFEPVREALFCDLVFGGLRACGCGREPKKEMRRRDMAAGRTCAGCGGKAHLAASRRRRFGHIPLASPVAHHWFLAPLGRAVALDARELQQVLLFERYLVIADGLAHPRGSVIGEEQAQALLDAGAPPDAIGHGAGAIERMLGRPHPAILRAIPVLPPHLRPLVPLEGLRIATGDVNDLYRRTINRNNRLTRLVELQAPEIILRNERRMLQEAVDALFDNERRGVALTDPRMRMLRSLGAMAGGVDVLDATLANVDEAVASGEISLARPKRLHRRLATLRAAGLTIEPIV